MPGRDAHVAHILVIFNACACLQSNFDGHSAQTGPLPHLFRNLLQVFHSASFPPKLNIGNAHGFSRMTSCQRCRNSQSFAGMQSFSCLNSFEKLAKDSQGGLLCTCAHKAQTLLPLSASMTLTLMSAPDRVRCSTFLSAYS